MKISNLFNSVKAFFKRLILKMTFKDWLLLLLLLVALILGISSRYYYNKSLYPTVIYDTDSLQNYKNKLQEEYVAKNMYVQTISQLKESNAELYNEIKYLKDHPLVVTKTKIETRIDTVVAVSDSVISPTPYNKVLYWSVTEPAGHYHVSGNTDVRNDFSEFLTTLTNITIPAQVTLDVIEQKDRLKVIARTDNPYVKISDMNSVVIDPKDSKVLKSYFRQKHWGIGPMVGIGIDRNLHFTPYIGVGVSYSIINF